MAVTLNEGNTNKLVITIPAKGDTDWAGVFQAAMQAISDHDHSGNGNGAKLNGSSLDDGCISTSKIVDDAVTGDKIANNSITADHIVDGTIIAADVADGAVTAAKLNSDVVLSTLNDVSSTAPTTGQYLVWDGSEWAPGAVRHISVNTTITSSVADTKFILSNGAHLIFSPSSNSHEIVNCEFISTDSACRIDQANILKRCTFNFAGRLTYNQYNPSNIEYNTGIIGGFDGEPDDANGDGFGSTQVGPCIFKGNVLDIKGSTSFGTSICFGTMSENNLTFSGIHNISTSSEEGISGDTDTTLLEDSNFMRFLQDCNIDLGYHQYDTNSGFVPAGSIFSNGEWLLKGVKPRIDIFSMSISEFTLDTPNNQWYERGALPSERTGLGTSNRLFEGRYKISYDITATTSNPGNDAFSILSGRNGGSVDTSLHDMAPDSSTSNTDRWVSEGQIFTVASGYYHNIEIKHFSDSSGINPTAISGYIFIEKL